VPGSERDLTAFNQTDHVDYSDGYITATFHKRTYKNALPFASALTSALMMCSWMMVLPLSLSVQDYKFTPGGSSVNVIFPVLGGQLVSGDVSKHFMTPIVKTYNISQCQPDKDLPPGTTPCGLTMLFRKCHRVRCSCLDCCPPLPPYPVEHLPFVRRRSFHASASHFR
jgi:hypothetical protein